MAEKCRSLPHGLNWKFVIFGLRKILLSACKKNLQFFFKTTKNSSSTILSHPFALRVAILKILHSISLFYGVWSKKIKDEKRREKQQQEIKLWKILPRKH